jgi:hypothetical protein
VINVAIVQMFVLQEKKARPVKTGLGENEEYM